MASHESVERALSTAQRAWRLFAALLLVAAVAFAALQIVPTHCLAPLERALSGVSEP